MRVACLIAVSVGLMACSSNPFTGESQISNTAIGAGTGAAVGAGAGYVVGTATNNDPATSAAIGAGVGAAAGAGIGLYMDAQETKLRNELQEAGVQVSRTGTSIVMTLNRPIRFTGSRPWLTKDGEKILKAVAKVMKNYGRTKLEVTGFISETEPSTMAQKRVNLIASTLVSMGIAQSRMQSGVVGAAIDDAKGNVELSLVPNS